MALAGVFPTATSGMETEEVVWAPGLRTILEPTAQVDLATSAALGWKRDPVPDRPQAEAILQETADPSQPLR